jgi:hypothetical protein
MVFLYGVAKRRAGAAKGPRRPVLDGILDRVIEWVLDSAQKHQDQENHEEQAKAATGEVTPTSAMRPGGQRSEQKDDKDD